MRVNCYCKPTDELGQSGSNCNAFDSFIKNEDEDYAEGYVACCSYSLCYHRHHSDSHRLQPALCQVILTLKEDAWQCDSNIYPR